MKNNPTLLDACLTSVLLFRLLGHLDWNRDRASLHRGISLANTNSGRNREDNCSPFL